MAVAVLQPREKKDPVEKLANAVQIARSIYGIYADSKAIEQAKLDKDRQKELQTLQIDDLKRKGNQAELESQGVISGGQRASLLDGMVPSSEGEKGSFMIRSMGPDGKPLVEWVKKAPKERAPRDPLAEELARQRLEDAKNRVTDSQSNAATFAKRLGQAENIFSSLDEADSKGTDTGTSIQRSALYPAILETENFRKRTQAERNFVNATLRRESGASISKEEFASAEAQYFPRPGDTDDVLEQKKQNRQTIIDGMLAAAGTKAIDKLAAVSAKSSPAQSTRSAPVVPPDIQKAAAALLEKRLKDARK